MQNPHTNSSCSRSSTETVTLTAEDANGLGDIKINHSVVASIVRLAALEVEGTHAIGGSFVDGIAEIFSKKESDRGVKVCEDQDSNYVIEVRVILRFGAELAKVALNIQQNIREQVTKMTMKPVSRVDVVIDGVKMADSKAEEHDSHLHTHTD